MNTQLKKILYIEDEEDLGNVVRQYLTLQDFDVTWEKTATSAIQHFQMKREFDLMIIDIQLPDMDGLSLANHIKLINPDQPFLFLTARGEKKDRLQGLKIGADDYITKPFDIDEMVLRIHNILRRNIVSARYKASEVTDQQLITIGDLILDKQLRRMQLPNGNDIQISKRESELFQYFFKHANEMVKREQVLLDIWKGNDYFMGRSLDVYIYKIRKILKSSTQVNLETLYGAGLILRITP